MPTNIFYDNKAAINITHDSLQHVHGEHVDADCYFIKDIVEIRKICMRKI